MSASLSYLVFLRDDVRFCVLFTSVSVLCTAGQSASSVRFTTLALMVIFGVSMCQIIDLSLRRHRVQNERVHTKKNGSVYVLLQSSNW